MPALSAQISHQKDSKIETGRSRSMKLPWPHWLSTLGILMVFGTALSVAKNFDVVVLYDEVSLRSSAYMFKTNLASVRAQMAFYCPCCPCYLWNRKSFSANICLDRISLEALIARWDFFVERSCLDRTLDLACNAHLDFFVDSGFVFVLGFFRFGANLFALVQALAEALSCFLYLSEASQALFWILTSVQTR